MKSQIQTTEILEMVSERLKTLFGKVKERLSELKPENIAKFAAKEAAGAIPFVGQIIKDAFDEFAPDEKEELIKELKELSESQFKEISEKVGVSVEYLQDIQKFTLYSFKELRADHEEIKELLRHLIEIITRGVELKPPEINIPTIQSTLRKEETTEGDFFKKEPEWIDFEEGFVVERKEVNEIIKKLENDNSQLVLGEPASGKSVILKNIGFKLANENKDVYIVELKKHSSDEVKRYFDVIPEINDEKAVFIVEDAYLLPTECERLVREFKNRKLKAKLIIGSRPTREIRGEHPKEVSEFEYLSKMDIHAEDVTEEMIRGFLKREYGFSDERIKTVSKNLEEYKKDLWHLSWALKAYNPEKDSVENKEIYEKIRDLIRNVSAGIDKPEINAEDVFLPLSVFYRFEIPIDRNFLEEQIGIEENIIRQLIDLSEIVEKEVIGKRRTLSLIHSSIAELYLKTYQNYPDFGKNIKNIFKEEGGDVEYPLFYLYMNSVPTNSLDVIEHLGEDLEDEKGGLTLLKKLIEDKEIEDIIEEGIEKEEDIENIGWYVVRISQASEEVALKLVDVVSSKTEKEEDIGKIGFCVLLIAVSGNKETGLKLANRINIETLLSKIEKEEDIIKIGSCVRDIAEASEEVALKLVDGVSSKIEKEEDIGKIIRLYEKVAPISLNQNVRFELVFRIIDSLSLKIEKEEDIGKIGSCVRYIAEESDEEVAREIANRIDIGVLLSKIEKEEDIEEIGRCVEDIAWASEVIAQEITNRLNPPLRKELQKGGWLR